MSTSQQNISIRRGHVTIFLATRARPEMMREVLDSLGKKTSRKDKTDLWIYVDEDDQVTRDAVEKKTFPDPGFPVHWHFGPLQNGLGDCYQVLWHESGRSAEAYLSTVDDMKFETAGWDEIVRTEFARYPDGVLLGFSHDPLTADQATYPVFGHAWISGLGRVYCGYFPCWYDDLWVEQIARMTGRLVKLPIVLSPIGGKGRTKRMRNLPFWARFLQMTLPDRMSSARKLIHIIHPQDDAGRKAALKNLEDVASELRRAEDKFSDIYSIFQEERHSELTPEQRKPFSKLHFDRQTKAIELLILIAQDFIQRKEFAAAINCLDCVNMSDLRVRQVQEMKAECLRGLGRNAEAEKISSEVLAAWPEMNFIRRLFRFGGAFANDTKRMLVGLSGKSAKAGKKS
jgi:hypothetical protein